MNLRDLQYLVALAEHRHFGRAADACFVSQPTLSTQIKKLEDELGVPLVERTPRKVLLTEVGRDIAVRARDVLNEIEQIRGVARRTLDPESGTVRLGVFPTLGPYLLPHALPLVRKAFPKLELLLVEDRPRLCYACCAKAGWTRPSSRYRCTRTVCIPSSCSRNRSCWRYRMITRWHASRVS
jgi:LysR family hydrogen peroxide-inducible transcriptional activator